MNKPDAPPQSRQDAPAEELLVAPSRRTLALQFLGMMGGAALLKGCDLPAAGPASSRSGEVEALERALSGSSSLAWVDSIFGLPIAPPGTVRTAGDLATKTSVELDATVVVAKGAVLPGDGGGGVFFWSSSGTDDGGTVIVPKGTIGRTGGCWKRLASGPLNVRWFGATGDGSTNDYQAFVNATRAAAGKELFIPDPPSAYALNGGTISLPARTTWQGSGKWSTKLLHSSSQDMVKLEDGAALIDLWLEGQGTLYTGAGIVMGDSGGQRVHRCRVVNFDDAAIKYPTLDSGSRSSVFDVEVSRVNADTGTGRYAIIMANGRKLDAVPRKFIHLETLGTCAIDFGSCCDVFVGDSFLGDLHFSCESRGVNLTGCRIANQLDLLVDGHNNSIVGCDVCPKITIAPGADNIIIGPNSMNRPVIIDKSENPRNLISQMACVYNPSLSAKSGTPTIGNGSLVGTYCRNGSTTTVTIELWKGSTMDFGEGPIMISLPHRRWSKNVISAGMAELVCAGVYYTATVRIDGDTNVLQLILPPSGFVTSHYPDPAGWAAGSTIRVCITYPN